jgi:hypothetical protein
VNSRAFQTFIDELLIYVSTHVNLKVILFQDSFKVKLYIFLNFEFNFLTSFWFNLLATHSTHTHTHTHTCEENGFIALDLYYTGFSA